MEITITKVFLLYSFIHHHVQALFYNNLFLTNVTFCESKNIINVDVNITRNDTKQYMDAELKLPFPLDDAIGGSVGIEISLDGETFFPPIEIADNFACKAVHIYFLFLQDVEEFIRIEPGKCPLASGTYTAKNFELQFNSILKILPIDKIRYTIKAFNNTDDGVLLCMRIDWERLPN